MPHSHLVPQDIHLALAAFVTAHKALLRHSGDGSYAACQYLGDVTYEEYQELTDAMYERYTSDSAAAMIQEAKQLFQVYAYKRALILF